MRKLLKFEKFVCRGVGGGEFWKKYDRKAKFKTKNFYIILWMENY